MKPLTAWALARLDEPSTYAGIAALIGAMKFLPHAQDIADQVTSVGVGVMALIAIVKAERRPR